MCIFYEPSTYLQLNHPIKIVKMFTGIVCYLKKCMILRFEIQIFFFGSEWLRLFFRFWSSISVLCRLVTRLKYLENGSKGLKNSEKKTFVQLSSDKTQYKDHFKRHTASITQCFFMLYIHAFIKIKTNAWCKIETNLIGFTNHKICQ